MKNQIAKLTWFGLVAAALAFTPCFSFGQDGTNSTPQTTAPKKHKATPFHGKVSEVDPAAQTFTVGTMTITVTPTTKIKIAATGEPGAFTNITVGEIVSGTYKKTSDGVLNANTVHIGKKKKKTSSEDGSSTTEGGSSKPVPAN